MHIRIGAQSLSGDDLKRLLNDKREVNPENTEEVKSIVDETLPKPKQEAIKPAKQESEIIEPIIQDTAKVTVTTNTQAAPRDKSDQSIAQTQTQAPKIFTQRENSMNPSKKVGLASYNPGAAQLSTSMIQDVSLNEISKVIETLMKSSQLVGFNVKIRPVPVRTDNTQNISYVLVECSNSDTQPTHVSYTAIVIASSYSATDLPTQKYTIRNPNGFMDQPIEIQLADSDVCDENLQRMMLARVRMVYPNVRHENITMAEPVVLPRTFNYQDADQIRRVLINAINAANMLLQINLGDSSQFTDLTLANFDARGTEDVEVAFTDDTIVDDVGLPRRADLRVTIATAQRNTAQDRNRVVINGDDASVTFAEVGGYVDLAWDCAAAPQNSMLAGLINAPAQTQVPKLYTPRVIVTAMRTMRVASLPTMLLTLATAVAALRQDNERLIREYFVGATKSSLNPYRDLAGVGYDLFPLLTSNQQITPLPTKGEQAQPAQLMQLLQQIFHPATFSIDVPEYGCDSWLLSPFLSAASGRQEAIDLLNGAADYLTHGEFSKSCDRLYAGRRPIPVFNDNNRVHAGYYQDAMSGRYVDIRSVDYLMMLNRYGAEAPAEVTAWSQSHAQAEASLEQRVAKRYSQIQEITANSAVQTGWHRRLTLGGEWLVALIDAISKCDYSPNVRDTHQYGVADMRTNASFLQAGRMNGTNMGFFNTTAPGPVNRNGMGGMFTRFDNFMN